MLCQYAAIAAIVVVVNVAGSLSVRIAASAGPACTVLRGSGLPLCYFSSCGSSSSESSIAGNSEA